MQPQVPHGPSDKFCPFWRKKMSAVCHTCPMWTKVTGRPPTSEQIVDQWDCAIAWLPTTTLEGAKEARCATATMHELRKDIAKQAEQTQTLVAAAVVLEDKRQRDALPPPTKVIEHADR